MSPFWPILYCKIWKIIFLTYYFLNHKFFQICRCVDTLLLLNNKDIDIVVKKLHDYNLFLQLLINCKLILLYIFLT